ncbi:hypothetical protein LRC39_17205 [Rhodopseudomonas sp. P1]|uniref:hypothetical protein n=1 Tax=Rhodopseudomonas sp. P1 TaxID=3434357 RepID=UPI0031FBDFAB
MRPVLLTALILIATAEAAVAAPQFGAGMKLPDVTIAARAMASMDFRAAVRDILNAEQVIQAALQTGDERKLDEQSSRLLQLQSTLVKETEQGDARRICSQAAGELSAVASLMRRATRGDEPVKSMLAAEKTEQSYRDHLASCDKAITAANPSR